MITHVRMKNFKSWKDSGEVKLAPLTGFFGTNSSGKSSLLQMLLLLKQTAERSNADEVIFFGGNGSLVNLGSFDEVIHGHNVDEPLELGFGCKFQDPLKIRIIQRPNDYPNSILVNVPSFNFKTIMKQKEGELNIEDFSYQTSSFNLEIVPHESTVYLGRERIGESSEIKNCYGVPASEESRFGKILKQFSSLLEKLFDHVYYLGPTRVNPRRFYHWEGTHPKEIDQWGGSAIDTVLSAGIRKLKSSNKEDAALIEDRISEWLQKMELAHSFKVIPTKSLDDQNYEVRIRKSPSSAEVTLADMGYGLADVLPMLIYCYYVQEGSTLILEQPGVHLHPKVQAELADFFIDVITERKLQVLVESHSEHLLNRLQRRIAEEKIDVEKTALYFCRNDGGVSNVERLKMDDFGNISNWPENFFGNEMEDLFAMTEAQSERRKRAEGE